MCSVCCGCVRGPARSQLWPLGILHVTGMMGTLIWRTGILRTKGEQHRLTQSSPALLPYPQPMLQYPTLPSFCLSSRDWVKSHQRLRPVPGRAERHMLRPSPALLGKPSSPLSLICTEVGKNTESSRVSFTHLLLMRISYITRHIWQSERSALE